MDLLVSSQSSSLVTLDLYKFQTYMVRLSNNLWPSFIINMNLHLWVIQLVWTLSSENMYSVCLELLEGTRINRLSAYCKGGNFNIHIWAWFGYSICLRRESGFIYNLVKS